MGFSIKVFTLCTVFLLVLGPSPGALPAARQQRPVSFSAEVVRREGTRQEPTSSGMIYVGQGGIRTETSQEQQAVWMIFKPEQKIVWTLLPKQRVYMERIGLSMEWPPLPEDDHSPCRSKNFRCQKTGVQTIENRSVVHWTIEFIGDQGPSPYAQLWVDPKLNVAIRENYTDGLNVEMRQIREAPQADSLFELPAGYQKVTLPTATENLPKETSGARSAPP